MSLYRRQPRDQMSKQAQLCRTIQFLLPLSYSYLEEWVPERNQLVQEAAKGPDVRTEVVGLPLNALWAHIVGGAHCRFKQSADTSLAQFIEGMQDRCRFNYRAVP